MSLPTTDTEDNCNRVSSRPQAASNPIGELFGDVVQNIGGVAQNIGGNIGGVAQSITHTVNDVAQNIINAIGHAGDNPAEGEASESPPDSTRLRPESEAEPEPEVWSEPARFSTLEEILEWSSAHYRPEPAPSSAQPADMEGETFSVTETADVSMQDVSAPAILELSQRDRFTLATITPPQTLVNPARPTLGAHCLVIDVSYSMEQAATVTTDDGDKVNHGFTVLDIAKHAMCVYVASLEEGDWVSVVSYATEARMVHEWTACSAEGKESLSRAIRGLKEEGSTNLTAGLATGFRVFEEALPAPVAANPSEYALLLAVATDGQPSSGTHPPAGPTGYAEFVRERSAVVAAAHGSAAVPSLVAIGLGNDLDSRLLSSFADTFLHIPDPGSVGPFMVNLLAATRATARLDAAASVATVANKAVLRLSPASSVVAVPGHRSQLAGDAILVPLGSLTYDQPRHVLIHGAEGAPPPTAMLCVGASVVATCAPPAAASPGRAPRYGCNGGSFDDELSRTAAVCALQLQEDRLSVVEELGAPTDEVAARLAREGGRFGDVTISLLWNDQADLDLHVELPSGEKIMYSHKKSACGLAELDVDMNAGGVKSKEPVENVYVGDSEKGIEAPRGRYKVYVNNYAYHSDEGLPAPRDVPFTVHVRMHGDSTEYTGVITSNKETIDVVEFDYSGRLEAAAEQTAQLRSTQRRKLAEKARLRGVPTTLLAQATALLPEGSLRETLSEEALLAVQPDKFRTWGRHYLVTLPQMLRSERRSNFRDAALQHFGSDARGQPAFFDSLSADAELVFAQLEPPVPSGLERIARQKAVAAAAPRYTSMPEEFMRGGGCFAPDAPVRRVAADGSECAVPIASLEPGDRVRTASGGVAAVRCVVVSPCEQGVATLSQLPNGLCLTEWHPLMDRRGDWRFPIMVGRRVVREIDAVYNLVLSREHVAMVGGVPCVTLGHGIEGDVVGHPFWGTQAVIDLLKQQEGWASGRILLGSPLRAADV